MAHRLVRSCCLAALTAALVLQGCGNSSSLLQDRTHTQPAAARSAEADSHAVGEAADGVWANVDAGRAGSKELTAVSTLPEQSQAEYMPAWLDELLHSPDPNVRVQGLDAWAQHPGASLDRVAYALVDSDEAVRTRAQELFEQELACRQ